MLHTYMETSLETEQNSTKGRRARHPSLEKLQPQVAPNGSALTQPDSICAQHLSFREVIRRAMKGRFSFGPHIVQVNSRIHSFSKHGL